MNKNELVAAIAKNADVSKKDAEKCLVAFVESVTEALKAGERVQIVGFGSFEVRERAAHKGRNPSTGEEITIEASKSPVFKAGKNFKDALAD